MTDSETLFIADVMTLREQARQPLGGGVVTPTYFADVKDTIEILQNVLATEIVCVLRHTMRAITATGLSSVGVKTIASARLELTSA